VYWLRLLHFGNVNRVNFDEYELIIWQKWSADEVRKLSAEMSYFAPKCSCGMPDSTGFSEMLSGLKIL
jgi:hypothetical protein